VKSKLADWAATEEDDFDYYVGEKRQRGGRKKRKKNREPQMVMQNWDDIYDPSRPNNYEEYRHSDEKILEVREWKDRLYAHRMKRSPTPDSDSDYDRPMNRMLNFRPLRKTSDQILTGDLQVNLRLLEALRRRRT
jgi:splicing factor 45